MRGERQQAFDDCIIWDLKHAPADSVERARIKGLKRIAQDEGTQLEA